MTYFDLWPLCIARKVVPIFSKLVLNERSLKMQYHGIFSFLISPLSAEKKGSNMHLLYNWVFANTKKQGFKVDVRSEFWALNQYRSSLQRRHTSSVVLKNSRNIQGNSLPHHRVLKMLLVETIPQYHTSYCLIFAIIHGL